jgi:hypothetical protein
MLPTTPSSQEEGSSSLTSFIYALKSPESQRLYPGRLKLFFNFYGLPGTLEEQAALFLKQAKENGPQWVQDRIIRFLDYHKKRVLQRKELSAGTLHNYYCAIKLFCEMNYLDTGINWKLISRGLPRMKPTANDRAPTIEEIRKLVEYPDRRIKPLVYTMCSSGIRIGAWQYLKWKHVTPMTNNGKGDEIIAAELLVYAGEPEEYYTFITPEAYHELKKWMNFRASHGEKITEDSALMRDLWQMANVKYNYGAKWGLATNPKLLQKTGIKKILNRALWIQGLRQPLTEGKRRHEYKTAHGLRKFFKTRAEQVMRPLNVELLLSHESGMSDYYYRPTEKEVLNDYLKAVDLLTINDNNAIVQKQLQELTDKSNKELYILKGQLAEKEREAEQAKKALAVFENKQNEFQIELQNKQKNFEDRMQQWEERQEKIFEQLMREKEPKLRKIKSKKKRDAEETKLMLEAGELAGIGGEEEYDEEGNPIPSAIYDEDDYDFDA